MHTFLVNAVLQILPITPGRHPYEWVDEAITIISQSGIQYEVGPFGTQLEGSYPAVMLVIDKVNEHLFNQGCPEWICSTQVQIKSDSDSTGNEKTSKFRQP